MNDLVVLRLNFGDTDTPALRCGGFEHLSHGGAALAHRLDAVTHAARAVRVLIAIFLFVSRRLHDAHARPIGFELVSDNHRQTGARAGAHLRADSDDGHVPVGRDRNKNVGVGPEAVGHLVRAGGVNEGGPGRQEFSGDHETACGDDPFQEAAAADILDGDVDGVHVTLLWQPP